MIIGSELASWAPFSAEPTLPRDMPVAFVTNLYYLTAEAATLSPPPYLWVAPNRFAPNEPVLDGNLDWRALYNLEPQTSLWRDEGILTVVFRLQWNEALHGFKTLDEPVGFSALQNDVLFW